MLASQFGTLARSPGACSLPVRPVKCSQQLDYSSEEECLPRKASSSLFTLSAASQVMKWVAHSTSSYCQVPGDSMNFSLACICSGHSASSSVGMMPSTGTCGIGTVGRRRTAACYVRAAAHLDLGLWEVLDKVAVDEALRADVGSVPVEAPSDGARLLHVGQHLHEVGHALQRLAGRGKDADAAQQSVLGLRPVLEEQHVPRQLPLLEAVGLVEEAIGVPCPSTDAQFSNQALQPSERQHVPTVITQSELTRSG